MIPAETGSGEAPQYTIVCCATSPEFAHTHGSAEPHDLGAAGVGRRRSERRNRGRGAVASLLGSLRTW